MYEEIYPNLRYSHLTENEIWTIGPGSRVYVFDWLLFEDDEKTPLSYTFRPATVICRYGVRRSWRLSKMVEKDDIVESIYPDQVDVIFDHRPDQISHGHFTSGVSTRPFS